MKKSTKILLVLALVSALLVAACSLYLGSYYKADTAAIGAFLPEGTALKELPDGTIVIGPEQAENGFIFYPGGKVEHTAYLPLMQQLSEKGVLCILVEMPFRLAVLNSDAAGDHLKEYPEIQNWYIGGHSLGGAMAANYLSENTDDFKGLVLLGAYSTKDLSKTNLKVLSVYRSEDKVLNATKYAKNKKNLPKNFTEIILAGGCHAYFGMYGTQKGDGVPTLSNTDQIIHTANAILALME